MFKNLASYSVQYGINVVHTSRVINVVHVFISHCYWVLSSLVTHKINGT